MVDKVLLTKNGECVSIDFSNESLEHLHLSYEDDTTESGQAVANA